jgi:BirA family biotin operon repressor/biotin-[acetyl-CoA-carboxylase] ligase
MSQENLENETIAIGKVTEQWALSHGFKTWYAQETTSTNEIAKQQFASSADDSAFAVYLTEFQTAGRGRGTHTWLTEEEGASLLSSWSVKLDGNPAPVFSCKIGMGLMKALWATWPFLAWSLKAPNDIYIGDKKVGGLLIENVIQGNEVQLVVGLGLNVFDHPLEIENATSILEALPESAPLMGEDWVSFLDRWIFELTSASVTHYEKLNTTECATLTAFLNKNPNLKEKVISISPDGDMEFPNQKVSWTQL